MSQHGPDLLSQAAVGGEEGEGGEEHLVHQREGEVVQRAVRVRGHHLAPRGVRLVPGARVPDPEPRPADPQHLVEEHWVLAGVRAQRQQHRHHRAPQLGRARGRGGEVNIVRPRVQPGLDPETEAGIGLERQKNILEVFSSLSSAGTLMGTSKNRLRLLCYCVEIALFLLC